MSGAHFSPHPIPDQSFSNTPAEGETGDGANPLYTGAMASVPSICEAIEQGLNLTVEEEGAGGDNGGEERVG